MTSEKRAPFRVRASSWGTLFDCAHRFEGTHILGLRGHNSIRAALGTAIHASTAAFDTSRMNGSGLSAMDTGGALIDSLAKAKSNIKFDANDMTLAEAQRIGLGLHARYCSEISPHYEYAAVEMETKPMLIDCGHGVEIELTGTMDRSRMIKDQYGNAIADIKTGAAVITKDEKTGERVVKIKGHAPQIGTYEMLYEHTTGGVITGAGEIIALSTSPSRPEVGTAKIWDARRTLIGTPESPGLIEYATEMFRSGLFPPNPQSNLCGEKYCARWSICAHHY